MQEHYGLIRLYDASDGLQASQYISKYAKY